jgi:predicted secreted protein
MRQLALVLRCALVTAFFVVTQGCVARKPGAAGVTVVTEQTGRDVSLKVGAVLEVRLKDNGYGWVTAPIASPVLMTPEKVPFEELVAGDKAGVEVWQFKAVKAGKQTLQFELCGPPEKSGPAATSPVAKAVTYSVTVD